VKRAFVGFAVIMESPILDKVRNAEQFSPHKWQQQRKFAVKMTKEF